MTRPFYLCSRADEWVSAAVDCLEFLPDQIVVDVSRNLPEQPDKDGSWKLLLFETISKYYNHNRVPLVTNPFFDIHTGIAELLGRFYNRQNYFYKLSCFGDWVCTSRVTFDPKHFHGFSQAEWRILELMDYLALCWVDYHRVLGHFPVCFSHLLQ